VHPHDQEEVVTLRKRHGQAARGSEAEGDSAAGKTEQARSSSSTGPGAKEFSWITAVTVGAQLALDIIRVIREATDLKRKLFPVKDGISGQVSGRESG
jgi:hypothetical protein